MAAGGIRVNGGTDRNPPWERTRNNRITDNWLHHYGQDYPSAVGMLLMHTEGNTVAHNHIHHGGYTGISIGWVWGYTRSVSQNNRIEFNHIHHIGGVLSDMGGIYTLGVSPGTVIRNNHIHDVDANHYGGWGIYHDEGSTHLLVENNVVHHTKFAPFNIHFAKEVTVRNNIFALGKLEQVSRGRVEPHKSVFFENNIVYWREGELFSKNWKDVPYTFHFHPKDTIGHADPDQHLRVRLEPLFQSDEEARRGRVRRGNLGRMADSGARTGIRNTPIRSSRTRTKATSPSIPSRPPLRWASSRLTSARSAPASRPAPNRNSRLREMMRSTRALGYAGVLVLVSCVSIRPERSASVPKVDQRVAAVMNTPGCVAFWDFVKREPDGAHRFTAHVPPGATNDYPLDAGELRQGLLGRRARGDVCGLSAARARTVRAMPSAFARRTDPDFRPFLFVPRARLHDTPLDIKGAGKSVSVVVWAIRESGNHALAGIWHEGTDLKQQETAANQSVAARSAAIRALCRAEQGRQRLRPCVGERREFLPEQIRPAQVQLRRAIARRARGLACRGAGCLMAVLRHDLRPREGRTHRLAQRRLRRPLAGESQERQTHLLRLQRLHARPLRPHAGKGTRRGHDLPQRPILQPARRRTAERQSPRANPPTNASNCASIATRKSKSPCAMARKSPATSSPCA